MSTPAEDIGESTITLPDEGAVSERRFYVRLGAVLLLAALAYVVWRIVAPLWQPLVWAALLGSVLAPLNGRLSRLLGDRPRLASVITTLLTVTFFLVPVGIIAGAVAAQAAQLLSRLNANAQAVGSVSGLDLGQVPWLARPLGWLSDHADISIAQVQEWLVAASKHVLQSMASTSGSFVLGALGTVLSFAVMLLVLFFVLRDGPGLAQKVVRMLPIEKQLRARLWQHLVEVTRAVFMGIGLTALIQGILVGIGFWIAGLSSPLVFGVLGVLFALVPVVGTVIVWGPAALWLAAHGDYSHAAFLAVWGVVAVGSVDNFLRPLLISGFIGLFLGPIVLGLLVALFRFESDRSAVAKGKR
jgi:predicted PurR-regulated permease PerM